MESTFDTINKSMLGLYCTDRAFLEEVKEVQQYYEFYEGRNYNPEEDLESDKGQLWAVKDRDYRPTREIRNITKKLMKKQGRFMTSVPPTIMISSVDGNVNREQLDAKRGLIEKILNDSHFWTKFSKAFMDCTIGKRVLLAVGMEMDEQGNPLTDKPLQFKFYTMPEFTYEFDPNNSDRLLKVKIVYQDKSTVGRLPAEQRWHKWTYEMGENDHCWCTYEIVDGLDATAFISIAANEDENGEQQSINQILKSTWDTGLTQLPCKVIFNDGLTGDVRGHSDVKDLMDMAMDYNKTVSDYRDALRFKMFEQPVFIDADSDSIKGIKIAPNSLIDLKSDPTLGDGTSTNSIASVTTLSSTFNFQPAVDSYLTQLKYDMYELMEQPLPERLLNVPSGKALKMIYYDLITRCEEKWQEWDSALIWLIRLIEECTTVYNLYQDEPEIKAMDLQCTLDIKHNYPIPDDEIDTKTVAIQEVEANVRSHKSYIEEFGYAQDADTEWETILEEIDTLNSTNNAMLGLDDPYNEGEDDNGEDDDDNKDDKANDKKDDDKDDGGDDKGDDN